jgi:glycosyltransferase involved in cell wall biosynthesis
LWWLPKDLLAYAQFDAVVAIGPRVYDDLRAFPAKYFLSTHKIRLINNGIDTSLFRPANEGRTQIRENFGVDERVPVVLSVSRLHRQKGVENVLKAFALLRRLRPESILLVAGDGPDRAHLEALTRELKQTDHVRFLGALDRNRLAEAYQISDVFAFLSEHVEGLPLNVLEALATGLPCVVSAHLRLFPSIFIHRFEYTDVSGVAGCLDRLLKAPHETNASELPPEYHLAEATQRYLKMFSSHDQQPR